MPRPGARLGPPDWRRCLVARHAAAARGVRVDSRRAPAQADGWPVLPDWRPTSTTTLRVRVVAMTHGRVRLKGRSVQLALQPTSQPGASAPVRRLGRDPGERNDAAVGSSTTGVAAPHLLIPHQRRPPPPPRRRGAPARAVAHRRGRSLPRLHAARRQLRDLRPPHRARRYGRRHRLATQVRAWSRRRAATSPSSWATRSSGRRHLWSPAPR